MTLWNVAIASYSKHSSNSNLLFHNRPNAWITWAESSVSLQVV